MVPLASHPQGTSGPREYFRNDDGQEGGRTSGNVMGGESLPATRPGHFRQHDQDEPIRSQLPLETSQSEASAPGRQPMGERLTKSQPRRRCHCCGPARLSVLRGCGACAERCGAGAGLRAEPRAIGRSGGRASGRGGRRGCRRAWPRPGPSLRLLPPPPCSRPARPRPTRRPAGTSPSCPRPTPKVGLGGSRVRGADGWGPGGSWIRGPGFEVRAARES